MARKSKKSDIYEKNSLDSIGDMLELPAGVLSKNANIVLASNREAVIDGCKGILEYSDTVIRINTGNMVVRFCGRGLEIRSLSVDQAVIAGFIVSVDFGS